MKKRKKRAKQGEPQTITKAVTPIRLEATNAGKLTALDQLSEAYLALTQQYTTLFCTDELPNGFRAPCFLTPLSERWHRNAIQQAAGTAKSWRTNGCPTTFCKPSQKYHQMGRVSILEGSRSRQPATVGDMRAGQRAASRAQEKRRMSRRPPGGISRFRFWSSRKEESLQQY